MNTGNVMSLIYNELKYRKKVKSQKDLGARLGYGESFTSLLIADKEKWPEDLPKKLMEIFSVSKDFLENRQMPILAGAQNEETPPQGQGLEEGKAKAPQDLIEILIRAEGHRAKADEFRAKADYERSITARSIADTNKMLTAAVVKDTVSAIENASSNTLEALPATVDGLRDMILDVLVDMGYRGPNERSVKAHRASAEKNG